MQSWKVTQFEPLVCSFSIVILDMSSLMVIDAVSGVRGNERYALFYSREYLGFNLQQQGP